MKAKKDGEKKKKSKPSAKSLANLKPFQKGKSGNAGGKHAVPEDIREARKHNNDTVERAIHRFFNMKRGQLGEVLQNPDTSVVDCLIGGIVAKAVSSADFQRAGFLLDRAGCRLPPSGALINVNVELGNMNQEELLEAAREALRILAEEDPIIIDAGVAVGS